MANMKLSTKAKRSVSRGIGIPTTRSGRSRKVNQATGGCMTLVLAVSLCAAVMVGFIASAFAESITPMDYVESRGFSFADISDADGYPPIFIFKK